MEDLLTANSTALTSHSMNVKDEQNLIKDLEEICDIAEGLEHKVREVNVIKGYTAMLSKLQSDCGAKILSIQN